MKLGMTVIYSRLLILATSLWVAGFIGTATISAQSADPSPQGPGAFPPGPRPSGGGPPDGRGGWPGGWGGGPPGPDGGFGFRRSPEDMMQRLDPNNTGVVEFDKLYDGRTKYFAMRAAQEAGLDITKPIPTAKLKDLMDARMRSFGGPPTSGGSSSSGTTPTSPSHNGSSSGSSDKSRASTDKPRSASDSSRAGNKTDKDKLTTSLVPGFGLPAEAAAVPGFGEALASSLIAADKTENRSKDRDKDAVVSSSSTGESGDEKIRKYAESLLKQYDANKNGILEKEEWKNMRGEPDKADANHDGMITIDELTEYLRRINRDGDATPRKDRGGPSVTGKTSKRYSTTAERLPDGLPSWFVRLDADGDGQITMAEFSTTWNEAKIAEFLKYDLNGDGVITAAEVLKVEKPAEKSSEKKRP